MKEREASVFRCRRRRCYAAQHNSSGLRMSSNFSRTDHFRWATRVGKRQTITSYIRQGRAVDKPFRMSIENVFSIEGRGTVVTGVVDQGAGGRD